MTAKTVSTGVELMPLHRTRIEAALLYAGGTHTYLDVVQMVTNGEAQFWPAPNSCIVTEIVRYPQKAVLNVFLTGGRLGEIQMMLPTILHWAVAEGCTAATFTGRKGWQRTFIRAQGWEPSLVMFSKDLTRMDDE